MKLMTPGQISRMPKKRLHPVPKGERPIYDKKNWPFNTEVFKEAEKIAGQNGYKIQYMFPMMKEIKNIV